MGVTQVIFQVIFPTEKRYGYPRFVSKYLESGKVSTIHARSPGSVFFALKGPSFNANAFAIEALAKGASYCVVDEPAHAGDPRCVLVPDVLCGFTGPGRAPSPSIDHTGGWSYRLNGKTTSKELVSAVLKKIQDVCYPRQPQQPHWSAAHDFVD